MATPYTARDIEVAIFPGLDNLRRAFTPEGTEQDVEKAQFFLKADRASTAKRGAETNQLRLLLLLAKQTGATPDDLRPVFQSIASNYASGRVLPGTAGPLAGNQTDKKSKV